MIMARLVDDEYSYDVTFQNITGYSPFINLVIKLLLMVNAMDFMSQCLDALRLIFRPLKLSKRCNIIFSPQQYEIILVP